MTEVYTPEILLQYIYKETNPKLTKNIAEALKSDTELLHTYQELQSQISILDNFKYYSTEVLLEKRSVFV